MNKTLGTAAAAALIVALPGCNWMKKNDAPAAKTEEELAAERSERIRKACASAGTYERLKELVFDEAARIRNSDARNLDPIAAGSVVRMEQPLVKSRDEDLNVTVCTGRFILELPPGAENAFDGMRRVSAEIVYSAQAAADGSGLVYQMDGADPIIYRLASVGLNGQPMPRIVAAEPGEPAPTQVAAAEPVLMPAPAPAPAPKPAPAPPQAKAAQPAPSPAPARQAASPSFNCRYARTSSEKRVCDSPSLASKDRQMASIYYAAMANADAATRNHLRRSRDAFLSRRERCGSDECVAAAYNARIAEIRRIESGG